MPDTQIVLYPEMFLPNVPIETDITSLPSWGSITSVGDAQVPTLHPGDGGVDMKNRLCIATVVFCHQGGWKAMSLCPLEPFGRQAQLWCLSGLDFTVKNVFFPTCINK